MSELIIEVNEDEPPDKEKPIPTELEEELSVDDLLAKLSTSVKGLEKDEATKRLNEFGKNSLPEESTSAIVKFFGYFWNPLSWMMEFGALLSIVLADYADFGLIAFLLILNAIIGFYEEKSSGDAVAALKSQLSPTCYCLRSGEWASISSENVVPGDIVHLKLGDVIPADCKIVEDVCILVDQASLTGESLPVKKEKGNTLLSGAIVTKGETEAVVFATGTNTFFGRAAKLVQTTNSEGHFQIILKKIAYFCIILIFAMVILELIILFAVYRNECTGIGWGWGSCHTLSNALVLIVGGLPIAMPTVLSVTMAIGATKLSKKQVIVTRLTAVEELASMNMLCSDKTGTLTLNQLSLDEPVLFSAIESLTNDTMMKYAALASNSIDSDAIDKAILESYNNNDELQKYNTITYIPFDPVSKKVVAKVMNTTNNKAYWVTKGAPQIIVKICATDDDSLKEKAINAIDEYANKGYRTIGVAVCEEDIETEDVDSLAWRLVGLIPLFDPPRHDTASTIKKAQDLGIEVKMITGDQQAIAKETCRLLNMGDNIQKTIEITQYLSDNDDDGNNTKHTKEQKQQIQSFVIKANGFAGVYPEHKYEIVKILQEAGYFVGMTGDGVNDAPALKKADIGIAVAGATDAARAASDIVLLSPGLGVIIDAITSSRKIFARMSNYAQYSITTTIRIIFTFGLLSILFNWHFTVIVTAIMAILNDGTIMTISTDKVKPSPTPNRWNLTKLFIMGFFYAAYLVIWTIVLFVLIRETNIFHDILHMRLLPDANLRGFIYLYVSISGQATIFITRSNGLFFLTAPTIPLLYAFFFSQTISTILGMIGLFGYPFDDVSDFRGCGWEWAIAAWIFSIITIIFMDVIKYFVNYAIFKWLPHPKRSYKKVKQLFIHPHPVYSNQSSNYKVDMWKGYTNPPCMTEVHRKSMQL